MPPEDLDDTIKVPRNRGGPPVAAPRSGTGKAGPSKAATGKAAAGKPAPKPGTSTGKRGLWIGAAVVVVTMAAGGGMLLWRRAPPALPGPAPSIPVPPGPSVVPAPPVIVAPPAASLLPLRSEAELLAQKADALVAARFAANTRILVLDFPTLTAQGQAFNRMAAFLEKMGLPRDRVLNDTEMTAAILADKATVETYYYGHDYRAADVARFYAAVDRQGLPLAPQEVQLRALLEREGLLKPGTNAAVISIPREDSDPFVDASGRASLLRHELSHGEYFTNPDYATFSRRFWVEVMDETDRAAFRGFLTRQDYDPANEDLLVNEMQAHLMHTTDVRYFNARDCGLPLERVAALRASFLAQMPRGWLQDATAATLRR